MKHIKEYLKKAKDMFNKLAAAVKAHPKTSIVIAIAAVIVFKHIA
jgi:hypothetical protein